MTDRLKALSSAGVSIWLDDLSRERLTSGNLAELIETKSVVGVTTNPTIFASALSDGDSYADQLQGLTDVDEAIQLATTTDVRDAADLLKPIYDRTGGFDGRVSIEVSPELAHDTDATVAEAEMLYDVVGRENLLVKIPATKAGIPAIAEVIGRGISVNVTLIFNEDRYREVMDAYLTGLETADAAGREGFLDLHLRHVGLRGRYRRLLRAAGGHRAGVHPAVRQLRQRPGQHLWLRRVGHVPHGLLRHGPGHRSGGERGDGRFRDQLVGRHDLHLQPGRHRPVHPRLGAVLPGAGALSEGSAGRRSSPAIAGRGRAPPGPPSDPARGAVAPAGAPTC